MENLDADGPVIRTVSGIYFNVLEPTADMVKIEDIAHALGHQCRFAGHLPQFYSVAEHSIIVSKMCSRENKLAALLHDASEAYLLDIPRPLKKHLINYHEIEDRLMRVIADKFGFDWPLAKEVKNIDRWALEAEWGEIMLQKPSGFCLRTGTKLKRGKTYRPLTPRESRANFITDFKYLTA